MPASLAVLLPRFALVYSPRRCVTASTKRIKRIPGKAPLPCLCTHVVLYCMIHAYLMHLGRVGVATHSSAEWPSVMEGPSSRPFFGRGLLRVSCNKDGVVRRSASPRPAGMPAARSTQQLKIPTPKELERMRQFRQQQHLRQHQLHRPPDGQRGHDSGPSQQQQQQQPGERPKAPKQRKRRHPAEPEEGLIDRVTYAKMAAELGLEPSWRPQVSVLHGVGLAGADLARLAAARREVFLTTPPTMRRKIKFLKEVVGLSDPELVKVLSKFPRILEYQMERTVRPRLDFLRSCGVPEEEMAKVVVKAPMVLELSVRDTLEKRAAFLTAQLGLREGELGKLVTRHPQVLTCTEDMLAGRVEFLRQHGLEQQQIGRAVLAHPQVLHYKIESMRERVSYLHSVGMNAQQVAAAASRFPQLFSLSVESNLAPKWRYLVEHLGGDVNTLCGYPGYLSLSLTSRIIPRHRYYQRCKPDAALPVPMHYLKCADKRFAMQLCGGSLAEYEEFRAAVEAELTAQQGMQRVEQEEEQQEAEQAQHKQQQQGQQRVQLETSRPAAAQQQQQQQHGATANGRAAKGPVPFGMGVPGPALATLRRVSRAATPARPPAALGVAGPAWGQASSKGADSGVPNGKGANGVPNGTVNGKPNCAANSSGGPRLGALMLRRLAAAGAAASAGQAPSVEEVDGAVQGFELVAEPGQQQGKAWPGGPEVVSNVQRAGPLPLPLRSRQQADVRLPVVRSLPTRQ